MKQSKFIKVSDFQQPEYPVTFIIGARGVGKTVSALASKLKANYDQGTTFIYLRRYQSEIETAAFNLELIGKLIGHQITRDFYTDKNGKRAEFLFVDSSPVCYLLSLSTAAKYKTNDYSDVTEIVYDEFIDPRGRELKQETKLFLNFAMTVFRDFSKYHALFLANATNLYNCYFLDFQIMPKRRITKFRPLGIKIVMYQTSAQLQAEHLHSVLGQQVLTIEGEGSSLYNQFDNQYEDFITKLTGKAEYRLSLRLNGHLYGYYKDGNNRVISAKADEEFPRRFAMTYDDATDVIPVVNAIQTQSLIGRFKNIELKFTDVKTRTEWIKFFKRPYSTGGIS